MWIGLVCLYGVLKGVRDIEKEKAKRMFVNYGIGLIVIFSILIACPYLVRGITALIT